MIKLTQDTRPDHVEEFEKPKELGDVRAWSYSALKVYEECPYRTYISRVKGIYVLGLERCSSYIFCFIYFSSLCLFADLFAFVAHPSRCVFTGHSTELGMHQGYVPRCISMFTRPRCSLVSIIRGSTSPC